MKIVNFVPLICLLALLSSCKKQEAAVPPAPDPRIPFIANGYLPDPKKTPGDIFPDCTVEKLAVRGYASSVRDVGTAEKHAVFREYDIPYSDSGKYEVDHLISLELGGSNEIANLWPQPYDGAFNAHMKDKLENKFHSMVVKHEISLADAQREIATDWISAYKKYVVAER